MVSQPFKSSLSPLKSTGEQSSPNNSNFDQAEATTYGLTPAWSKAFKWAARNRVTAELIQAINLGLLRNMSGEIGHVLACISREESLLILQDWSNQTRAAIPFLTLAEAAFHDRQIFADYPRPTLTSSRKLYHSLLKSHYLVALSSERAPRLRADLLTWLERLRLWVLVHGLHRSQTGNYQDISLREVASKLRMAYDRENNWRSLFCVDLYSDSLDFDEINRFLIYRSERLLASASDKHFTSSEMQLLRELIKVALLTDRRDNKRLDLPSPIDIGESLRSLIEQPYVLHPEIIAEGDEESEEAGELFLSDEEAGIDLLAFGVEAKESYAHQRLQGNTIFLNGVEALQYLPWSWAKPNPFELQRIYEWMESAVTSTSMEVRYVTSVVWLAITLGRSFRRTLDIKINAEVTSDWTLDPRSLLIKRLPPRRQPGWSPKSNTERSWVTSPAPIQSVNIDNPHGRVLLQLLSNSGSASNIGELWDSSWTASPDEIFKREISRISTRLTGSMLAAILPQSLHNMTGDHAFARMLSSHPATALPAACAYASWPVSQCSTALGNSGSNADDGENGMGSLLDPIEERLRASISAATDKLESLSTEAGIIEFHNACTAYVAVTLFAATGGRPIRDPFESHAHFDFEESLVHISDKHTGEARQSRLAPLPAFVCRMVGMDYLAHLNNLIKKIEGTYPSLATDVSELLVRNRSACMPFLFFIGIDGSWESVSEEGIMSLELFDWPLPLNLFRHRLSKQLRKHEVDPEIIDSIMGHAEGGAATHGDFSVRTWRHDMDSIKPALEASFFSLGFAPIPTWAGPDKLRWLTHSQQTPGTESTPLFGSRAREKQRIKTLRSIIRDARIQITNFLAGRSLSELDEKEIDNLSRELLFQQNGMPHPRGYRKYQILIKRIEHEWRNNGRKVKISRRYQTFSVERSPFSELAPRATATFNRVQSIIKNIDPANPGRMNPGECAVLSATLLCIENRISDTSLLNDILQNRNHRLVSLRNQTYLEYVRNLERTLTDEPLRRFRISSRTAILLDRALDRARNQKPSSLPTSLKTISSVLNEINAGNEANEPDELINQLAAIVDQYNAMTLPGIMAGYLAGRIESYSPSLRNWVSRTAGHPITLPEDNSEQPTYDDMTALLSAGISNTMPGSLQPDQLQINARSFLGKISAQLPHDDLSDKATSSLKRRNVARRMQQIIDEHEGQVSTAILILGRWVVSLLFRKVRGSFIQASSIYRYLASLRTPFEEVANNSDLMRMDGEDVTYLYIRILKNSGAQDKSYVARRLTEFHRFARREYSLEDPDWQELPELSSILHVSPSTISEKEYIGALKLLTNSTPHKKLHKGVTELILLFCYRFGLRLSEALGLLRSDLVLYGDHMVIHVRNNRYRRLKTPTSRRQVPLLFKLSKLESELIAKWIAHHEGQYGGDHAKPLFHDEQSDTGLVDRSLAGKIINSALQISSSNPNITLHHARHSAINDVALSVLSDTVGLPHLKPSNSILPNTALILLGRAGPTRRVIWALSRYLGHVRRETTLRNYLHFLGEWSDKLVLAHSTPNTASLKNVINLDALPSSASVSTDLLSQVATYNPPSTGSVLMMFRLIARGRTAADAASALSLDPELAAGAMQILQNYGDRVRLSKVKHSTASEDIPAELRVIRRIKEPAWNRLILHFTSLDKKHALHDDAKFQANVIEMLGAGRQLLLWEDEHFELLMSFIEHSGFSPDDFFLVKTESESGNLDQKLKHFDLAAIPLSQVRSEKHFQMDTATTHDGRFQVRERCAFVFNENDSTPVRNSVELVICFMAFFLATKFS